MSATLNIGDFINDRLFPPAKKPPVVEAEGRQHRVTTHFALRSRGDYVEEVVEKVRRAHRKLPKGGILVFLTGQNEIREVSSRLQQLLGGEKNRTRIMRKCILLRVSFRWKLKIWKLKLRNPTMKTTMTSTRSTFKSIRTTRPKTTNSK